MKAVGIKRTSFLGSISLMLAACGGDSTQTSNPTLAEGVFKDSNVSGLHYISGGQSGITDSLGRFTYEVGQEVIFSLGGVRLGSASGADVITPLDFIADADIDTTEIQNMIGLFIHLDADQNPDNGIQITAELGNLAQSWSQVDLSSLNFTNELAQINSDLTTLFGSRVFPDLAARTGHFQSTLACLHSGAFQGTHTGNAPFASVLNPITGVISGFAQYTGASADSPVVYRFDSDASITYSNSPEASFSASLNSDAFTSAVSAAMSLQFDNPNTISGTWGYGDLASVLFSGQRLSQPGQLKHRISGLVEGDLQGVFEVFFNGARTAAGSFYSVTDGQTYTLSGSLDGEVVTLTGENGLSFSGQLTTDFASLDGEWSFNQSSGSFSGAGCVTEQEAVEDRCELLTEGRTLVVNHGSVLNPIINTIEQGIGSVNISLQQALGGVFGSTIDVGLGNGVFSGRSVVSGEGVLSNDNQSYAADVGVSVATFGDPITASASVSLMPSESGNSLTYSCTDNVITVNGDEAFTGVANATISIVNLSLTVNTTSSVGGQQYRLELAPTGDLWLFPLSS